MMKLYANLAGVEVGDGFPVRLAGAINVSPESFYGGSVARGRDALQRLARRMVEEGADIIDVGAMTTAPYQQGAIGADEEQRRMRAAVRAIRAVVDVPISVDTQRSRVAAAALDAGAAIINDVSGLGHDPAMGAVAADAGGVILMAS
ncbi:MAG: dihydropteroate synthase, partial [Nevskiales bacterium]